MSILTKEGIQKILNDDWLLMDDCEGLENCTVIKELARMALAAMDSEPVGYFGRFDPDDEDIIDQCSKNVKGSFPLYRHAQPVSEREQMAIENFRSAMEGIGHIRRTLEETFGGLHGTHVEPDVLAECKAICDAIYAAYGRAQPAPVVMDDRKLRSLFDSWFASDCSFDLSPEASEADNIAWRESYWYVWQRCRAAMLQAGISAVIPDGYVMVPMRLTAENGAKAALLGEFNLEYSLTCHECFGEGCDDCSGEGTWTNTIPIDWTTIKEIWAKGVEHFAAALPAPKQENI
ncbi:hypothetical protein [Raoultella ornithinolytica]|uniref:hypothetical protein n=1 Tax=Raoultella ornithinolytica TaxID=54291 RepID=UPI003D6EF244